MLTCNVEQPLTLQILIVIVNGIQSNNITTDIQNDQKAADEIGNEQGHLLSSPCNK